MPDETTGLLVPKPQGNGRTCCFLLDGRPNVENRIAPEWVGTPGNTSVEVCRVCGAKHYRANLSGRGPR